MIHVFGSINVDFVFRMRRMPGPGETVMADESLTLHGGKGANQAVAAARALGRPGGVAMHGAVGDDPFGPVIRAAMEAEGIDTNGIRTVADPTGRAVILLDDSGENSITVAAGANARLQADAPAYGGPGDLLVMQMEVPFDEVAKAATIARAAGCTVLLNLAPAPEGASAEAMADLLGQVDILVVNEHELALACTALGLTAGDSIPAAVAALAARIGCRIIATLGAEGVCRGLPGGDVLTLPAIPVDVVDTTGAGDTFVGAYAAGLAEGLADEAALRRAIAAAALTCRKVGAQSAMPRTDEIDALLAGRGATT